MTASGAARADDPAWRDAPVPATGASRGLCAAFVRWRNRRIADPAFRDWAAAFPLTRPIARRRSQALFDLCAGFVASQVLLACVRLRLCEVLLDGPMSAGEAAARMGLPPQGAKRLLDAAAALGLAQRVGGGYAAGPLGAALAGNAAVAAMIEHNALLYADLADPVGLLRSPPGGTRLAALWPYAAGEAPAALSGEAVADYSALMAASQPFIAADVLAAYRVKRHRWLLDIGGGEGRFAIAALTAAPHLRATVFDLPAVAERARARLAEAGFGARADAAGGDMRGGELPRGADLITLVRVLHDHEDATGADILRSARAAIAPGGTVLVAEPMADTRGAESVGAYFALYLHAMGSGRLRSAAELGAMLRAAGFSRVRERRTRHPGLTRVLTASVNPS